MAQAKVIKGYRLEPFATCAGAMPDNAQLNGAYLYSIDPRGAELRAAHLADAHLAESRLAGADLSGAKFCKTAMPDLRINDRDC